ncbi:MAG: GcrA family cell cycle regulator [Acetobacteraceae bacterium]
MEWTEELITHLQALWGEGRSSAEIGRAIGMTKNAVIGKAHRMNLPSRPSPIRREPGATALRPRPLPRGPTLPPLATIRVASPPEPKLSPPPRPARCVTPSTAETPARPVHGREMACCWPLGDPGMPGFHFCGAVAALGKPYCAAHAQLAYVRVRDRREDAA